MWNIRISSVPEDVSEIDRAAIYNLAAESQHKLQLILHNKVEISIHFKEYSKTGSRKQYEVQSKLIAPGLSFAASSKEWDAVKAANAAIQALEKEVSKGIHRNR